MSVRKNWSLILSSLMLVVVLVQPSTDRLQHSQELLGNPAQTQRVDGGGPVPPLPPPSFLNTLTADGGGPVPPLPPPSFLNTLTADGGGPVPPLPPPSFLNTLTADGGGPVPPLPPPNATLLPSLMQQAPLLADGGGPVPPLPPPLLTVDFVAV